MKVPEGGGQPIPLCGDPLCHSCRALTLRARRLLPEAPVLREG